MQRTWWPEAGTIIVTGPYCDILSYLYPFYGHWGAKLGQGHDDVMVLLTGLIHHWTFFFSLLWRHNERDSVSNHQPHDCLLNRSFRCRSNETSKPCVTSLCAGISPVTGEFPPQKASNAENVPIWWRHHVIGIQWLYATSLRRFKCKSGKVSLSFLW